MADAGYLVRGTVIDTSRRPAAGIDIRAIDVDLRAEQELGRAVTDEHGHYQITYSRGGFVRGDKATADLVVRALGGDGAELAASPVRFNAGRDETVDLTMPARELSEIEQLAADCLPVMAPAKVTPAALTDADIAFLSAECGWAASRVRLWSKAAALASEDLNIDFWYAVTRIGLPGDPVALSRLAPAAVRAALARAVRARIVPAKAADHFDGWLAVLRAKGIADEGTGIPAVLAAAKLDDKARHAFAGIYHDTGGDPGAALAEAAARRALDPAALAATRSAFALTAVVGSEPVLLAAAMHRTGGDPDAVVALDAAGWGDLLRSSGAPVPAEVGGDDPVDAYAALLARGAAAAHPQLAVVARLSASAVPDGSALAALLRERTDIDLASTDVAALDLDPATTASLGALSRVYRLSADFDHVEGLLASGLDSAYAISRLGAGDLVARLRGTVDATDAVTIHRRATTANARAAYLLSRYRADLNGIAPGVIGGGRPGGDAPAQWSSLFGGLDFCACPDCRSVFGPAAYLVDLLHLLADRPAGADGVTAPLDALLARRPDLAAIELTCANTNTELAVIDLVAELCESRLTHSAAPVASRRSTEELMLSPEYVNDDAYRALATAVYPLALPLDRPWEELRAHLGALGTSRAALLDRLSTPGPTVRVRAALDRLGLAPVEHDLVTGAPAAARWGLGEDWLTVLATGPGFLTATGLGYDDAVALLGTAFARRIAAVNVHPACSLDEVRVTGLTPALLAALHGFLRIRRATGWTTGQLDAVLRTLGASGLDDATLVALAGVHELSARLRTAPDVLVGWWDAAAGTDLAARDAARSALARAAATSTADLTALAALRDGRDVLSGPEATAALVAAADAAAGWSLTVAELTGLLTDAWRGRFGDPASRAAIRADLRRADDADARARRLSGPLGTDAATVVALLAALPADAAALAAPDDLALDRALVRLAKAARIAAALALDASDVPLICGPGPWLSVADLPVTASAGGATRDPDVPLERLAPIADFFTRRACRQRPEAPWAVLLAPDVPAARLAATLGTDEATIGALVAALGLTDPAGYVAGTSVLALDAALAAVDGAGVTVATALTWVQPAVTPAAAAAAVASARRSVPPDGWAAVERPLRDRLRTRQRDALVAALTAPTGASAQDLTDDLLIDVKMEACQVTSRIQAAIAAVQTYVTRCLLGEEPGVRLSADLIAQWDWMRTYRVWEANRRVFCYPEDYLLPQLRDDKTPFFVDLEHGLTQGELTDDLTDAALATYLESLDSVARLRICGIYHERRADASGLTVDRLHVVARGAGTPTTYWYRVREDGVHWSGWEPVAADLDAEEVVIVVQDGRVYLCWAITAESAERADPPAPAPIPTYGPGQEPAGMAPAAAPPAPDTYLDVTLAYTRREHDGWAAKQTSDGAVRIARTRHVPDPLGLCTVVLNYGDGGVLSFTAPWSATTYHTTVPLPLLGAVGITLTGSGEHRLVKIDGTDQTIPVTMTLPRRTYMIDAHDIRLVAEPIVATSADLATLAVRCYVRAAASDPRVGLAEGDFAFGGCHATFTARPAIGGPRPVIVVPDFTEVAAQGADGEQSVEPVELPVRTVTPGPRGFPYEIAPDRIGDLVTGGEALFTGPPGAALPSPDFYHRRFRLVLPQGGQFFFDDAFAYEDARYTFLIEPVPVLAAATHFIVPAVLTHVRQSQDWKRALGSSRDVDLGALRGGKAAAGKAVAEADLSAVAAQGGVLGPGRPGATEVRFRARLLQHPYVCRFSSALRRDGAAGLFTLANQQPDQPAALDFARQYAPQPLIDPRYPRETVDFEADGPYALYNWELFVHAPLLIAQRLRADQRYDQARRWLHRIFDPTAGDGPAPQRYWNVAPLRDAESTDPVDELRVLLGEPEPLAAQVAQWARHPFQPWRVAAARRTAIGKAVVMEYLDLLIAWGDSLFREYTRESVNEAALLYATAARLLGPRPNALPGPAAEVETFATLRSRLDGFSNALVGVETMVPPGPSGSATANPAALRALASVFYFCVPPNARLLGYWDTIADRLFKIRHCEDIDGVVRDLALFEPPIDPSLLIGAAAAGTDLAAATARVTRPPYRFAVAVAKALELCADVRGLGAALTGAYERRDVEQLTRLRSTHELAMLAAVRAVRQAHIDDSLQAKVALQSSRAIAEARRQHYTQLIADGLSDAETAQLDSIFATLALQAVAGGLELASGIAGAVPNFHFGVSGFGGSPHVTMDYGGSNVGAALGAAARATQSVAGVLGTVSSIAGTYAGFGRRQQEWTLQAQLAGQEVAQLDAQLAGADIRIAVARAELANHDLQTAQSRDVDARLRSKFTNAELYDWTADQLSALYFGAYRLACEAALKAQACFAYEQPGDAAPTFIAPAYWDGRRAGLLAGERLHADLRRMESAYLTAHTRDHELVKLVSLATIDPLALVALRTSGRCQFALTEDLFDADQPGQVLRRVKSLAVTLPAVIGPYSPVSARLTLASSQTRLPGGAVRAGADDRPSQNTIVTSRGNADSGLFETNLRDERYLPFEGCGAVSTWQLDLDPDLNDFDVQTLSDVIVELHYTARDNADADAVSAAKAAVLAGRRAPRTRLLSARTDFADSWYEFLHPMTDAPGQTLRLALDPAMFGYRARESSVLVDSVQLALVLGPRRGFTGLGITVDGAAYRLAPPAGGQLVTAPVLIPFIPAVAPGLIEVVVAPAAIAALAPAWRAGDRLDPAAFADLLILPTVTVTP